MPIRWDKRNKCYRFEFNRRIQGKRHRISKLLPKGWTQAEADAFDRTEAARLYAVASGVRESDPLITEAVQLYLDDKTELKSYKQTVENIMAIAWAYVDRRMSELPSVADAVSRAEGWSPATKRNRLAILKAACRHAWKRHGLTAQDPTGRMVLPEVRNERHVYATRKQMLQMARAAKRHDVRVLIRTAFYTGMRRGELCRVVVDGDTLVLADTKNGDRRSLPAHPRIRSMLRYLPLTAPFPTLRKGFVEAREAVGLQHVRLHDLRHSAASEMVNSGVDLYTVGQVLGHRDARSTARYSHLSAATLAAAVSKIGRQKNPHTAPATGKKKATG
jgi:integrase